MVYCCAPRHASEIGFLIVCTFPHAVAIELQKHLLHHVLGVMGVAQHSVGHPKDKAGLALDEFCEPLLIAPCQVGSILPFTCKDGGDVNGVQLFFAIEKKQTMTESLKLEVEVAIDSKESADGVIKSAVAWGR